MDSLYLQNEDDLKTWLKSVGEPAFRAGQILSWPFKPGVTGWGDFRNLPRALQSKLDGAFSLRTVSVLRSQGSAMAVKNLLLLADGNTVECVLLSDDRDHHTVCLSTQVGCAMGCRFCATGQTKSTADGQCFVRNLTADEIIQQVLFFADSLPDDQRITNLVVMGMGEPMLNIGAVLTALDILSDRLEIGARKITVSTVGITEGIHRLAEHGRQYHLAISLHAPNDQLRDQIVPANHGVGISAILAAADDFFETSGRRVTYEYVLLRGVNDSVFCAEELADLLRGRNAMVNLIPYNEVAGLPFHRPTDEAVTRFTDTLSDRHIQVQVRVEKGSNIDAACGQLRRAVTQ